MSAEIPSGLKVEKGVNPVRSKEKPISFKKRKGENDTVSSQDSVPGLPRDVSHSHDRGYFKERRVGEVTTKADLERPEGPKVQIEVELVEKDLEILNPLMEKFQARYDDHKMNFGRVEEPIRSNNIKRINEDFRQEMIKLGIVSKDEQYTDSLFDRTKVYVEKANQLMKLVDEDRDIEASVLEKHNDRTDKLRENNEKLAKKNVELTTAKERLKKLNDALDEISRDDEGNINNAERDDAVILASTKLERAQKTITSLETEVKDLSVELPVVDERESDRKSKQAQIDAQKAVVGQLWDKFHVKNPNASWDSESKKVNVEAANTTEPLTVSEPFATAVVTASDDGGANTSLIEPVLQVIEPAAGEVVEPVIEPVVEPIPVLTGDVLPNNSEAPLNDPSIGLFKAEYEQSGYVSPDMIKYPEEVEQLRENVEALEDITDDIAAKRSDLEKLDAEIASKRDKSAATSLDEEDGNTEGAYDAGVLFNQMSANGNSKVEEEDPEIIDLLHKRQQLISEINGVEFGRADLMSNMNLPADQLGEYMRLGAHLGQAMTKAEKINSEISFAKEGLEDITTSELAKKIGLEQTERAKAGFLSVLELERSSAIATVNQISERMMAITATTATVENDNRAAPQGESIPQVESIDDDLVDEDPYDRLAEAMWDELGEKLDVNLALPEGTVDVLKAAKNQADILNTFFENVENAARANVVLDGLKQQRDSIKRAIIELSTKTKSSGAVSASLDAEDEEESELLVKTSSDTNTDSESGLKDPALESLEKQLATIENAIRANQEALTELIESNNRKLERLGLNVDTARKFLGLEYDLSEDIDDLRKVNTKVHFVEDKIKEGKLNESLGLTLTNDQQLEMLASLQREREEIFKEITLRGDALRKELDLPPVNRVKVSEAEKPQTEANKRFSIRLIWTEIKSFLSKTIGKEAPKSTKITSLVVALGLIGGILLANSRIISGSMLVDDILSNGNNPAGSLPDTQSTTPSADSSTVLAATAIPAAAAFTKAITDAAKSNADVLPEVNLDTEDPKKAPDTNATQPSVQVQPASVVTKPVTAPQVSVAPVQSGNVVVEATKPQRKLAPVKLEKGSSLSAEYHKRGEFVDVKDWSNPRAMEMVSQMVVDNITNPSFWDALFDQNPDLLDDPVFKELVKKAQSKDFSEKDRKDIIATIKGVFLAEKLTAEDIAQSLGLSNVQEGRFWNIPESTESKVK